MERRRNFFFLRGREESVPLDEFAAFDGGQKMAVDRAAHKAAGAGNLFDRFAPLKSSQCFSLAVIQALTALRV